MHKFSLSNVKLATKTTLLTAGMVFVAMATLAGGASYVARSALYEQVVLNVERSRDAGREAFSVYLDTIESDLNFWATNDVTRDALRAFEKGWNAYGGNQKSTLQELYITENAHPLGEKDKLDAADDASAYAQAHLEFHPTFRALKDERGYYDVFLFNMQGDLIYSVFKELDYATNLQNGEYANSGLGRAFKGAIAQDNAYFDDFAPYAPSYGAPASFISHVVKDASGEKLGVLSFQMPIDRINAQLGDLGNDVTAYFVGGDFLMRNADPRVEENTILELEAKNEATNRALTGETGIDEGVGVDGREYLRASAPLQFHGVNWAFVSEIPLDIALAPIAKNDLILTAVTIIMLALATICARIIALRITNPVIAIGASIDALSKGGAAAIAGIERKDEIGDMARVVDSFRVALQEREDLAQKQREETARGAEQTAQRHHFQLVTDSLVQAALQGDFSQRIDTQFELEELNEMSQTLNAMMQSIDHGVTETRRVVEGLAKGDLTRAMQGDFKGAFAELQTNMGMTTNALREIAIHMRNASQQVHQSSQGISSSVRDLADRTESQATALEETAATMEEMTATIRSSADHSSEANSFANEMAQKATRSREIVDSTVEAMQRIESSSKEISDIITVIDSIAFQTNLLALNAAVEAARAGSAGAGFAVVASEVRALAQRAADAASEIKTLIKQGGGHVAEGVGLVKETGETLHDISESIGVVARRISEISDAGRDQSIGVDEVSRSIGSMDEMTQNNARMVDDSAAAAASLADQAEQLRKLVEFFNTGEVNSAQFSAAA